MTYSETNDTQCCIYERHMEMQFTLLREKIIEVDSAVSILVLVSHPCFSVYSTFCNILWMFVILANKNYIHHTLYNYTGLLIKMSITDVF